MAWFSEVRAARRFQQSAWRAALQELPPTLAPAWQQAVRRDHAGIRTDALFFACAAEGLMAFFDAATRSRRPCALPSGAADSVWQVWLRWDAAGLDRFCRKHFGATVPYVANALQPGGALLNTLVACVRRDARGRPFPLMSKLPALFALDAGLGMPDGHAYAMARRGAIVYARLAPDGSSGAPQRPHPDLAPLALFRAGLIDIHTLDAIEGRRPAGHQDSGGAATEGWDRDDAFDAVCDAIGDAIDNDGFDFSTVDD